LNDPCFSLHTTDNVHVRFHAEIRSLGAERIYLSEKHYETRPEAREKAIEKFNEIYNK